MPTFNYRAIDRAGKPISGQIEAASREAVLKQLTRDGHFPIDAVSGKARAGSANGGGFLAGLLTDRPRPSEVTLLTRELAMLLRAGVTLTHALSLIEAEGGAARVTRLARRLRSAIASGGSLSDAMAAEGETFPPVYVGMVKAAEATGTLDDVLERIAETREREQKLRAKLTSALLYPSLLIITAIAAVILLLTLVVPRFKEMLSGQGNKLPPSAGTVIAMSDWLIAWGDLLAAGILALLLLLLIVGRRPAVKRVVERVMMRLPGFGHLLRMTVTVRFCRTMGVLLGAGVGLPSALSLTRDVIGHEGARALIGELGKTMREGGDFAEVLSRAHLFPALVASMLRVGAETGKLSASALHLADMYEGKLEVAMQRLLTILEPLIIILVSVFVAFVVLSIMSAVVGVYDLTT